MNSKLLNSIDDRAISVDKSIEDTVNKVGELQGGQK
jgi:hypothetical protein